MLKFIGGSLVMTAVGGSLALAASVTPTSYFFQNTSLSSSTVATATLNYVSTDYAATTLRALYPTLQVSGTAAQPLVALRGSRSDVEGAKKLLQNVDKAMPQVRLEVQVLEVNALAQTEYRQLLSALNQEFTFNFDVGKGTVTEWPKLQGLLQQMENHGDVKLVAKPQLITLSQRQAHIQIGDRIPYPSIEIQGNQILHRIDYADTGIFLALTPTIHNPTEVSVDIMARLSAVKEYREVGQNRVPVLSTREAQTQVRLKQGETLVLAGLLNNSDVKTRSGVPVLMDIPILGTFFQDQHTEQRKTDVIFLIKPQIQG